MDAIAILAKKAAATAFEKKAISLAPFTRFMRSAGTTMQRGGRLAAPLVSSGGQFSPGRTAATLGAPLAAAGAYNTSTAPPTGQGSLGWHHQAIKGEDFAAPARGWFSPTAWGRAISSPMKSVASMFANNGPDKEVGGWNVSGGTPQYNPATGSEGLLGGQATRSVNWSPHAQGLKYQYDQSKSQYGQAETAQRAQIEKLLKQRQAYAGGTDYRRFGNRDALMQAYDLDQQIGQARDALKNHSVGGGSYGQMQDLEQQMRSIGMLGRQAARRPGTAVPQMAGGVRRSSPDDIYDALRMSAYSPY